MTQQSSGRPRLLILTSDEVGSPYNVQALQELAEGALTDAAGLADALPGTEVLLMWDFFSTALADAWKAATDLRWVHVAAAGVDSLFFD